MDFRSSRKRKRTSRSSLLVLNATNNVNVEEIARIKKKFQQRKVQLTHESLNEEKKKRNFDCCGQRLNFVFRENRTVDANVDRLKCKNCHLSLWTKLGKNREDLGSILRNTQNCVVNNFTSFRWTCSSCRKTSWCGLCIVTIFSLFVLSESKYTSKLTF